MHAQHRRHMNPLAALAIPALRPSSLQLTDLASELPHVKDAAKGASLAELGDEARKLRKSTDAALTDLAKLTRIAAAAGATGLPPPTSLAVAGGAAVATATATSAAASSAPAVDTFAHSVRERLDATAQRMTTLEATLASAGEAFSHACGYFGEAPAPATSGAFFAVFADFAAAFKAAVGKAEAAATRAARAAAAAAPRSTTSAAGGARHAAGTSSVGSGSLTRSLKSNKMSLRSPLLLSKAATSTSADAVVDSASAPSGSETPLPPSAAATPSQAPASAAPPLMTPRPRAPGPPPAGSPAVTASAPAVTAILQPATSNAGVARDPWARSSASADGDGPSASCPPTALAAAPAVPMLTLPSSATLGAFAFSLTARFDSEASTSGDNEAVGEHEDDECSGDDDDHDDAGLVRDARSHESRTDSRKVVESGDKVASGGDGAQGTSEAVNNSGVDLEDSDGHAATPVSAPAPADGSSEGKDAAAALSDE